MGWIREEGLPRVVAEESPVTALPSVVSGESEEAAPIILEQFQGL